MGRDDGGMERGDIRQAVSVSAGIFWFLLSKRSRRIISAAGETWQDAAFTRIRPKGVAGECVCVCVKVRDGQHLNLPRKPATLRVFRLILIICVFFFLLLKKLQYIAESSFPLAVIQFIQNYN